jgi:transposase
MPWNEVTAMEQKHRFVSLAATGRFTFKELCTDFRVSRKTGYKWLRRYEADGVHGLQCRSRRPRRCPHHTPEQIERLILRERRCQPTWGPKKLRELLRTKHRIKHPPAGSTIAGLLRRHGLSQRRRCHPGLYPVPPSKLTPPAHPNHVWTVDFKGCFLLGNQQGCDPLTVCDRYSHYSTPLRHRINYAPLNPGGRTV